MYILKNNLIKFCHNKGRYNKFSRNLCQTPWVIDGAKHMETSIQELICDHLLPFFKAESMQKLLILVLAYSLSIKYLDCYSM